MHLPANQKKTRTYGGQTCACEAGGGGWGVWGLQMQPVTQRTDKRQGPIVYTTGNFRA